MGSSPEHFFRVQSTNREILDTSSYIQVLSKQETREVDCITTCTIYMHNLMVITFENYADILCIDICRYNVR